MQLLAGQRRRVVAVAYPNHPGGITLVGWRHSPCKTTANLKLWKNSVDFKGTILDFSGAANIECVRVQYSLERRRL
ncbi:hypothetical protein M8494_19250 [Serratia ureilytica]